MKKVVDITSTDEIQLEHCDRSRIYAFIWKCQVFKLQQIAELWVFCSLGNSWTNVYGEHKGFQTALKEVSSKEVDVFEFADYGEFIRWCYERLTS